MPGRGQRDGTSHKPKLRRIKAKHQRKRVMRAKDPVLAVFMWGVQHTVSYTLNPDLYLLVSEGYIVVCLCPPFFLETMATLQVKHGRCSRFVHSSYA